jgi:hypothetical protein
MTAWRTRNHNGRQDEGETDPLNPDEDGDLILDGVEDADQNGEWDLGETDPFDVDSDDDGLPDGVEDANQNGSVDEGETDPRTADSDGDGAPDGLEDANRNGRLDPGETNPASTDMDQDGDGILDERETLITHTAPDKADTDADGLTDLQEDRNQNGRLDEQETDPLRPDMDCDALLDGQEDANANGELDPGETSPRAADSDGDKLLDGVERGVISSTASIGCPPIPLDTDPSTTTLARVADTDGDGINDGTEDVNRDGQRQVTETDPNDPDSDDDGVVDGLEDRNQNHIEDPGETDPLQSDVDTDGDGISDRRELLIGTNVMSQDSDGDLILDGEEDPNQDGILGAGETDPLLPDTDCDGLFDGVEDADRDHVVDDTETDPRLRDTDGDGLPDGVEAGWPGPNGDPVNCVGALNPPVDLDPLHNTNPREPDSDRDGLLDGAEDANGNGRVDAENLELDPLNPTDARSVDLNACATANLRPVRLLAQEEVTADILLALASQFDVTTTLTLAGAQRGSMAYSTLDDAAVFALKMTPSQVGGDMGAELAALQTLLGTAGQRRQRTVTAICHLGRRPRGGGAVQLDGFWRPHRGQSAQ